MANHGTRSRYVTGCRCGDCKRSNADYQRRLARVGPTIVKVDVDQELLDHLADLREYGMGLRAISKVARVSRTSINGMLSGRVQKVTDQIYRKLLEVEKSPMYLLPGALVDAGPVFDDATMLLKRGVDRRRVAEALGLDPDDVMVMQASGKILAGRAQDLERLKKQVAGSGAQRLKCRTCGRPLALHSISEPCRPVSVAQLLDY